MYLSDLYADVQAQADSRNEEVLVMVLKTSTMLEPFFDFVGIEIACELAMATGYRKARLRRLLLEHFSDRFNLDDRFGFEKTGL